jgi:hypothetical protein
MISIFATIDVSNTKEPKLETFTAAKDAFLTDVATLKEKTTDTKELADLQEVTVAITEIEELIKFKELTTQTKLSTPELKELTAYLGKTDFLSIFTGVAGATTRLALENMLNNTDTDLEQYTEIKKIQAILKDTTLDTGLKDTTLDTGLKARKTNQLTNITYDDIEPEEVKILLECSIDNADFATYGENILKGIQTYMDA